jgi:DNA-binding response OmpR family regulator
MPEPILIVDDAAINRKLAQRVLAGAGYNVRSVGDAQSALKEIGEFSPRLVLTDLRLEGMDGFALTRQIKQDPRMRSIVVIAVTGCGTEDVRRAAREAGCDDFVVKPIDTRRLPALIEEHLTRQQNQTRQAEEAPDITPADLPLWASELCNEFLRDGSAKVAELLNLPDPLPELEVRRAAHIWAGLGGTFGYPEITSLARRAGDLISGRAGVARPACEIEARQVLECIAALFREGAASQAGAAAAVELPDSLVQSLTGKRVHLLGFDTADSARLGRALERAQVQWRNPERADAAACDLVIAKVDQPATAQFLQGNRNGSARPVLLAGDRSPVLLDPLTDFIAAPWRAEEMLMRASRLIHARHSNVERPEPPRDRKLRVVIADDDPTVLTLLKTTVQNYGLDCATADEGDKALEMIRSEPPDAVILDVIMPNLDGLEVLAAVRNDARLRNVRVLMLSALQQETDIVRAFGLGADDYVTKPFSPVEVVARLKRLVRAEP